MHHAWHDTMPASVTQRGNDTMSKILARQVRDLLAERDALLQENERLRAVLGGHFEYARSVLHYQQVGIGLYEHGEWDFDTRTDDWSSTGWVPIYCRVAPSVPSEPTCQKCGGTGLDPDDPFNGDPSGMDLHGNLIYADPEPCPDCSVPSEPTVCPTCGTVNRHDRTKHRGIDPRFPQDGNVALLCPDAFHSVPSEETTP
jgi:hypothetical protein